MNFSLIYFSKKSMLLSVCVFASSRVFSFACKCICFYVSTYRFVVARAACVVTVVVLFSFWAFALFKLMNLFVLHDECVLVFQCVYECGV